MRINHPIFHVMRKEFLEVSRSVLLRILLVAPIMMSLVFGFVVTTDIKNVPISICDEDNTSTSRELIDKLSKSDLFRLVSVTPKDSEIEKLLLDGKARLVVRIPHGFTDDVKRGRESSIQIFLDGSDSNSTMTSMTRILSIIRMWSSELYQSALSRIKINIGNLPSVEMAERIWYNPELKSSLVMLPGLIGVILAIVTIIVTAVSLVREKESGNIEQLNVTPVKPWHVLIGKIIPYVGIAFIDMITLTLICRFVFLIPIEGSVLLLFTFAIFMVLANLGIGILISTVSKTQQQAMLASIIIILPTILLSGLIFAIRNMPLFFQALTYFIPMRYFLIIVRGIFLKGAGFVELWPQALALLIFSSIVFTIAILRFKKVTQ